MAKNFVTAEDSDNHTEYAESLAADQLRSEVARLDRALYRTKDELMVFERRVKELERAIRSWQRNEKELGDEAKTLRAKLEVLGMENEWEKARLNIAKANNAAVHSENERLKVRVDSTERSIEYAYKRSRDYSDVVDERNTYLAENERLTKELLNAQTSLRAIRERGNQILNIENMTTWNRLELFAELFFPPAEDAEIAALQSRLSKTLASERVMKDDLKISEQENDGLRKTVHLLTEEDFPAEDAESESPTLKAAKSFERSIDEYGKALKPRPADEGLRPCPSCVEAEEIELNGDDTHYWITCFNCGTSGPINDTEQAAREGWNAMPRKQKDVPWADTFKEIRASLDTHIEEYSCAFAKKVGLPADEISMIRREWWENDGKTHCVKFQIEERDKWDKLQADHKIAERVRELYDDGLSLTKLQPVKDQFAHFLIMKQYHSVEELMESEGGSDG